MAFKKFGWNKITSNKTNNKDSEQFSDFCDLAILIGAVLEERLLVQPLQRSAVKRQACLQIHHQHIHVHGARVQRRAIRVAFDQAG